MTNGEKFKEVFGISQVDEGELYAFAWLPNYDVPAEFYIDWWNAEYKVKGFPSKFNKVLKTITSQEPFINKPCVSSEVCEHDKNKVLDKIRAEIVEVTKCPYGTECLGANCPSNTDCMICGDHVLEILDKYKTESEE